MWIPREISSELRRLAQTFPAVVLIGPRQVGKTSILEHIFPEYAYVSLDVRSHAEMAETRPHDFLRQFPPPVILDEIQYAPTFLRRIKTYVDAHRGENGLFLLTGSQNFLLMEAVTESLAGRAAVIPFLGLSGREWRATQAAQTQAAQQTATGLASGWQEFLWRGGFPALWASPDLPPSRERWYQGYVATYLERDIRNLLNIGNLRDFERFVRACAARCGQTLNFSELGRDVGVSTPTAKQWVSLLHASYQVLLLEPYYRSLGKRLAKSPKLYFTDTGLAAYLMGFSAADALWYAPQAGALWENYVVTQWLRWRDWHEPSLALWYWRDQGGNEVDLLLERNQQLLPIECKLTEHPDAKALRGIKRLKTFYGEAARIGRSYIACPMTECFDLEDGVTAVSGWTTWPLDDGV